MIFFNDTATTEIYTLSLHDALPILEQEHDQERDQHRLVPDPPVAPRRLGPDRPGGQHADAEDDRHVRSGEHTSELQSRQYLVCRLLLEKKKQFIPCCRLSDVLR